jgi:hypothetical protein
MDTAHGNSFCSYLYLKLAKMSCFCSYLQCSFFCKTGEKEGITGSVEEGGWEEGEG